MKLDSHTPYQCYQIAASETERYQSMATQVVELELPSHLYDTLIAKRDAASRIARLIRFGAVEHNHTHDVIKTAALTKPGRRR